MHTRRYSAFISYRHADNTQEGRRWAEWLHRSLERYVVPPDLIGTPDLRGDPIRDSLYPIFRDEDELPANADLATGIRAALEVSDHLIVLCSAISPWVRKEVKEFKELGRSDRILAIIIAGEPNADDPAKAREGILRDEECFCEELRFGAVRDDGTLDWTTRTEPTAADLRAPGTRAEGFVTAEGYRENLTLYSSLAADNISALTETYRRQLDHALLKVIAGLLGVALGTLKDRDAAHRTTLAEAEAAKQREIAERERSLADQAQRSAVEAHRAKLATERTARRLAIACAGASVLALLAVWFGLRAAKAEAGLIQAISNKEQALKDVQNEKASADQARKDAVKAADSAKAESSERQKLTSSLALAIREVLAPLGEQQKRESLQIIKVKVPKVYEALYNQPQLMRSFDELRKVADNRAFDLLTLSHLEVQFSTARDLSLDEPTRRHAELCLGWIHLWKAQFYMSQSEFTLASQSIDKLQSTTKELPKTEELVRLQTQSQTLANTLPATPKVVLYTAKSVLNSMRDRLTGRIISYSPQNVGDNNNATAWCAQGGGEKQWIKLTFAKKSLVSSVHIIPGYAASIDRFHGNGRVKEMLIEFDDGSTHVIKCRDIMSLQTFKLPGPKISDYALLHIVSVTPGRGDDHDVPISTILID